MCSVLEIEFFRELVLSERHRSHLQTVFMHTFAKFSTPPFLALLSSTRHSCTFFPPRSLSHHFLACRRIRGWNRHVSYPTAIRLVISDAPVYSISEFQFPNFGVSRHLTPALNQKLGKGEPRWGAKRVDMLANFSTIAEQA